MARTFLAPEVLQISTMDCGVAALSTLLAGYGVEVSYSKLREACQTSVDGTSIDALEDLCVDLGVDVLQHVVPPDLVWAVAETRLPLMTILTIQGRDGLHYVSVWRRLGSRVQVMDPRMGRRWPTAAAFREELYVHRLRLGSREWCEWFPTSSFREALESSCRSLLSAPAYEELVGSSLAQADVGRVAAIDAAARVLRVTRKAGGIDATPWRDEVFRRALASALAGELPASLYSIRHDDDTVETAGAILLAPPDARSSTGASTAAIQERIQRRGLTPTRPRPVLAEVLRLVGADGVRLAWALGLGVVALALATTIEMLVYRATFDAPRLFTTTPLRLGVSAAVGFLLLTILGVELCLAFGSHRLGRQLEMAIRLRTLWALPRVSDTFVRSRPTSDLAHRVHELASAGLLVPGLAAVLRATTELAITLLAIGLVDPTFFFPIAGGALLFVGCWVLTRTRLHEVDAQLQVHSSKLLTVLLDSLRGVRPVRLHGFQNALRNEQLSTLDQWTHASESSVAATAALRTAYGLCGTVLLVALFVQFVLGGHDPRTFVLLALWSFRIPPAITSLVQFAEAYPGQKNSVERLLELANEPVELGAPAARSPGAAPTQAAAIRFVDVSVMAGGQQILSDINLDITSGEHVAIVGRSGSGKSSLVGILLGFHEPSEGSVTVDGEPLDRDRVLKLRPQVAWIDPSVQLWNTSLGENLEYAARGKGRRPIGSALEEADLLNVLGSLERGLATPIGSDGSFLSGGEGQRLRIGRALLVAAPRIAVLDEAFRGLEREVRDRLVLRARRALENTTLLFVSHDVSQAMDFDRVLVIEEGTVVEDGDPRELAGRESRFSEMLAAERRLFAEAWDAARWRNVDVRHGTLVEADRET